MSLSAPLLTDFPLMFSCT